MLSSNDKTYILISSCRNESAYIDGLIDVIAAQTIRPTLWIILDDGSTDDTYDKALIRSGALSFLTVVKIPAARQRSFTSKALAAMHGYQLAQTHPFSFVGFLDADIRVKSDYYECLLNHFAGNARLGLGGGAVIDKYKDRLVDIRKGSEDYHVAGAVQFFRRACFDQIGGFLSVDGGKDTIADIMSMMHGWDIRVFSELEALHLRPDGFVKDHVFRRGMKWGRKFYLLGYHPLYYFAQCVRRLNQRPMVLSSACQLFGFFVATIKGEPRPVDIHFVRFLRKLQMKRLSAALLPRRFTASNRKAEPNL